MSTVYLSVRKGQIQIILSISVALFSYPVTHRDKMNTEFHYKWVINELNIDVVKGVLTPKHIIAFHIMQ